jgi:hypothetical protein
MEADLGPRQPVRRFQLRNIGIWVANATSELDSWPNLFEERLGHALSNLTLRWIAEMASDG